MVNTLITVRYGTPTKISCAGSIYVSFKYDPYIVNTLRSYPDRVYDVKTREWELPQESLIYLRGKIKDKFKIIGEPVVDEEKENKVYQLPKELKTKLYKFQEEDYQVLMNHDKYLLLNQQGLGKAIESITVALGRKKHNKIKHCLVIVCVNGLKYNYLNEIELHTKSTAKILGASNKKNISTQDKLNGLDNLDTFFIITNIESLRQKEILEKIKKLVRKGEIGCIICDEVHHCKNSGSQQGKALLQLAKYVKYFYGLTGTPIMNSPLDVYVPLKLVGREVTSKYQFLARYAIRGGFGGYSVIGFRNMEELQNKLDMVSIRRLKKDVLELPPKIYIDEYVEMSTKQAKLYENMKKAVMEDINPEMFSVDPLGQLLRLRQVTAFTSIISDTINESAKFERLKEILEETDEKIIIFSQWTTVTDILYSLLKEYNPAIVTGKVSDRQGQIKKFKEDETCKVIVGSIGALGTGFTLTEATIVVFFDEPWTWSTFEQATDRAHRIGTNDSVNIISLICKNTIDEWVHRILKRKKAAGDAVIDKKYNINDKRVLEYLITGDEKLLNDLTE